jgi:hypothetical protein
MTYNNTPFVARRGRCRATKTLPKITDMKKQRTVITDTAGDSILDIVECRKTLEEFFSVTSRTIRNWIRDKSPMLTTPDAVDIISQFSGLSDGEILIKTSDN